MLANCLYAALTNTICVPTPQLPLPIVHWLTRICIGEESFEHANVLSEKINFSALGGPGVAIFGPDDLHPMY